MSACYRVHKGDLWAPDGALVLRGFNRTAGYMTILRELNRPQAQPKPRIKCGILVRRGSLWIGAHWSPGNRRWCINLIPCVTFWITLPGGNTP